MQELHLQPYKYICGYYKVHFSVLCTTMHAKEFHYSDDFTYASCTCTCTFVVTTKCISQSCAQPCMLKNSIIIYYSDLDVLIRMATLDAISENGLLWLPMHYNFPRQNCPPCIHVCAKNTIIVYGVLPYYMSLISWMCVVLVLTLTGKAVVKV